MMGSGTQAERTNAEQHTLNDERKVQPEHMLCTFDLLPSRERQMHNLLLAAPLGLLIVNHNFKFGSDSNLTYCPLIQLSSVFCLKYG